VVLTAKYMNYYFWQKCVASNEFGSNWLNFWTVNCF